MGTRQLEGELAEAAVDLGCPPVAARGEALYPAAIYRNESELTGDEEGSEEDEDRNG